MDEERWLPRPRQGLANHHVPQRGLAGSCRQDLVDFSSLVAVIFKPRNCLKYNISGQILE